MTTAEIIWAVVLFLALAFFTCRLLDLYRINRGPR